MNYAQRIIQKCGGVRALARLLERPVSTVGSWGDRGSIPDEDKAAIMSLPLAREIGLEPADFFPVDLLSAPSPETPNEDAA